MSDWSPGPTCIMTIEANYDIPPGTIYQKVEFPIDVPLVAATGPQVDFTISLNVNNIGASGTIVGAFLAELYLVDAFGNKTQVDKLAPTNITATPGNSVAENHTLTANRTPGQIVENYEIHAKCAFISLASPFGSDEKRGGPFTAIMDIPKVAALTLDYLPVSIVYCPPNQDMTASLTNSQDYGTRMTIGNSADFIALPVQQALNSLGLTIGITGPTTSQDVTNQAQNTIELSYFRETVLTADNQRAIGRAYWGPLSDLFVLAKSSRFAIHQSPTDAKFYYVHDKVTDLIILPAHKLLRPRNDAVANHIPDSTRRSLLELDPFITNLDQFFPDSGADLSAAVDTSVDPSANNRAELLGRWWLKNGREINYSIGEKKELKTLETTEVKFLPGASAVGVDLSSIFGPLQGGNNYPVTIGLQSSKETSAGTSQSAACFLMRNQNEKDLSGIAIYYDKIFSTIMFASARSIISRVQGRIIGINRRILTRIAVVLSGVPVKARNRPLPVPPKPLRFETMTDESGKYEFINVTTGQYI